MKQISFFLAVALFAMPAVVRAQDAAVEERLNKLSAQIQDLVEAKDAQNRRIEALAKDMESLRQQMTKPNATYATTDDLKRVAERLQEIDRKRQDDNNRVLKEIENLGKSLGSAIRTAAPASSPSGGTSEPPGYNYTVGSGDTLSAIAKAYSAQGIKVTAEQIEKANPGLVPEKMQVGQKIFIPAPRQ